VTLEGAPATELETTIPPRPQKRDALGQVCFILHFLPLIFIVSGWLSPWRGLLIFYLVFLPVIFVQWKFNKGTCVLNNIESLIRTGRWRNPSNREEGAWLRTLVNDKTGWNLSHTAMDIFINAMLVIFWCVGFARLKQWV
jgi:hypothetical protein